MFAYKAAANVALLANIRGRATLDEIIAMRGRKVSASSQKYVTTSVCHTVS